MYGLVFAGLTCLLSLESCLAGAAGDKKQQSVPNILFCLADDWAWPHSGSYGDKVVQTPNFDRVAREGFLFTHACSAAPSCTPSRAAILTGQYPHRLEQGANLHSFLPAGFAVYPDVLEKAGYAVGFSGKGWGPGNFQAGGRVRNPAGPVFKNFKEFLTKAPSEKPFCFWFGSHDPHRPYEKGAGAKAGMKPEDVFVPPYLPDTPEVRSDILDYYFVVQRFDHDVGKVLQLLESSGRASNTLVVISGDNGWPFPRGKANLYEAGTRQPLAIRWPAQFKGGRTIDEFVNLADLAPTFLEAAGIKPMSPMTAQSLLGLLAVRDGQPKRGTRTWTAPGGREAVFVERERHANVRKGDLSYPARAIETRDYLYIRNSRPERWPAGDPEMYQAVGPFGDCDNSPSKEFILSHGNQPQFSKFFELAFAKRPAEELYDLAKDPYQLTNVARLAEYAAAKTKLRQQLEHWMKTTADPRYAHDDDRWDKYPYFGAERKK